MATTGTWFSPDQLGRMQKEFGLSPLATELIGQAPQMIKHLQGMGGGGPGLGGMLGGGNKNPRSSEAGERKDKLLAIILQGLGGTPPEPPTFAPAPQTPMTPAPTPPPAPAANAIGPPAAPAPLPAGHLVNIIEPSLVPQAPEALPGMFDPDLERRRQALRGRPAPDDPLARYLFGGR